jgi:hypothetical protein
MGNEGKKQKAESRMTKDQISMINGDGKVQCSLKG